MHLDDPDLLERLRRRKGLTRTELAAQARKTDGKPPSRQLVSYYLDGKRRSASRALADSISAALGVDTDTLWIDM
jgi:transcriptional regulator with XRE-family HTH domain